MLFVGQRLGIASAVVEVSVGTPLPMSRNSDGYWAPPIGMTLGGGIVQFRLTDTSNRQVSFGYNIGNTSSFSSTGAQFPPCSP